MAVIHLALALLSIGQVSQQETIVSPAVQEIVAARTTPDDKMFVQRLDALADAGDMSAVELLGELYNHGSLAAAADPARACRYFARAAAVRGDAAQNLATCHYRGRGLPADMAKARLFYAQARKLGYLKAGCALGNMMIAGQGGPRDIAGGLSLCRDDAAAGDPDAAADYGGYLLMGRIVPKDAIAARRWLAEAAQRNHANAAFLLGQIYWNGDGVAADRTIAARWLRVAYDRGRVDAAVLLGREAIGRALVKRDGVNVLEKEALSEGRQWLGVAAEKDPNAASQAQARDLLATLDGWVKK